MTDTTLQHSTLNIPSGGTKADRQAQIARENGETLAKVGRQLLEAASIVDPVRRAERIAYLIGIQRRILDDIERRFNSSGLALLGELEQGAIQRARNRADELGALHQFFQSYRQQSGE